MGRILFGLMFLLCGATPAWAKIRVVTTIPDLAWAAREIGGDKAEVTAFLKGTENPHFVDAVPAYIRMAADADVVCAIGLGLEMGWLPKVLAKSGNAKVQKGGKGFCEVGPAVEVLAKGGAADRSMGDVHPEGNPHVWLSPKHLAAASAEIARAMGQADEKNAAFYREQHAKLVKSLDSLHGAMAKKLLPAATATLMQYHSDFDYFLAAYGLKSAGSIEEKPGVVPSAGRMARVGLDAKQQGIKLALAVDYDPKGTLDKFQEISGTPVLRLATMVRTEPELDTYPKVQERMVDAILKTLGKGKNG